jgi:hypothetical protein
MVEAAETDLPPIVMRVGRTDRSVTWRRKPAFIRAVQEKKQGLFAGWDNGGHGTAMREAKAGFPNWFDFGWHIRRFAANKSYPALTGCSLDQDPGDGDPSNGDIEGFINRGFDWDGIEDTSANYRVRVRCCHPAVRYPVIVDVTPRRRRRFLPRAGTGIDASNMDDGGKLIENKRVVVEGDGRVTFPEFMISSAAGNWLVLKCDDDKER